MLVPVEITAPPTPLPGEDSPRLPSSAPIDRNATVTGVPPRVVVVLDEVELVVVLLGAVVDVVELVVGGTLVVLVVVDEDVVLELDDVLVVEDVVVLDGMEVVELLLELLVDDDVLLDVVVPGLARARSWLATMLPRPVTRSYPTPAL